jgi:hypothetical protein
MSSLSTSAANFPSGPCGNLPPKAYGPGQTCYNAVGPGNNFGNGSFTLSGVYFFSGNLTIGGNASITNPPGGTATLILLPGSTLTINGTPTIQLTAPSSVSSTQVPAALATQTQNMTDLLIYDPETTTNQPVNITGNSSSYFDGTVYAPNADVKYGGNSSGPASGCYQVIAYGVTFSGNTTLDDSGCASNAVRPRPTTVRLVQ